MDQGTTSQGSLATADALGDERLTEWARLPEALQQRLGPVLGRVGAAVERFFAGPGDACGDAPF
jgi:hypothetical protein